MTRKSGTEKWSQVLVVFIGKEKIGDLELFIIIIIIIVILI